MTWYMTNKEKYEERKLNREFKKKYSARKDQHLINRQTGEIKPRTLRKTKHKYTRHNPYWPSELAKSAKIAFRLRELHDFNHNLNQAEIDFIENMIRQFSWTSEQSDKIFKLRQKVFKIGFLTEVLC